MQSNDDVTELDYETDALGHYIDCLLGQDQVEQVIQTLASAPVVKEERVPTKPVLSAPVVEVPPPPVNKVEQGVKRIESPPELKALPQAQSSRGDLTLALFDMASFHFAVSVDKLAGIQVIADELLITPDTPSWMLGKLGKGKNAMVILDPRGFSDKNLDHSGHTPQSLLGKKLVVIAGGRYAFISDHVDKVQEVQADTIKWNNHPENRPWLSGVVMADALAILDAVRIEEIANQWLRSR